MSDPIFVNQFQVTLLDRSHGALKQSVYASLVTQTRLKPYLEAANEAVWCASQVQPSLRGSDGMRDLRRAA